MPAVGRSAIHTDEMIESGFSQADDFDGVIDQVIFAPFDYRGARFRTGRDMGLHLASYVMYTPDEGETDDKGEQLQPFIEPYNAGKLLYYISSSRENDPESSTSDIAYPGDPEYPDGGDEQAYIDAFEEIFNEVNGSEDSEAYQNALIDQFGGVVPFSIGRKSRCRKIPSGNFSLTKQRKFCRAMRGLKVMLQRIHSRVFMDISLESHSLSAIVAA